MVSTLRFDQAVTAHAKFRGCEATEAQASILEFLGATEATGRFRKRCENSPGVSGFFKGTNDSGSLAQWQRCSTFVASGFRPYRLDTRTLLEIEHGHSGKRSSGITVQVIRKSGGVQVRRQNPPRSLTRYDAWTVNVPNVSESPEKKSHLSRVHELEQYEQCAEVYLAALKVHPHSETALASLGSVLAALNRNEEAARALERAIELNPESAFSHSMLAQVYAELGKRDAAFSELLLLKQIDPNEAAERELLVHEILNKARGAPE